MIDSEQKICREELTMVNVVIFFKKQFPAKFAIDNELEKLTTHGFVQKWFTYFANREDKIFGKHSELDDQASSKPTVMQFHRLEGVFIIGFAGLSIACVVFAAEIIFG